MTHGSLFSGIGGFDLAAQWAGWHNVIQVEKDAFCRKVLEKNFPAVRRYEDIKNFNGYEYKNTIDVISGGFPCQPFSVAGRRKGAEDDRFLWHEMLRIIREIRPHFVVGENVAGIISMELDQVLTDLEAEGYATETFIIPACGLGAWHRRNRVWIIAYSDSVRKRFGRRDSNQQSEIAPVWESLRGPVAGFGQIGLASNPHNTDSKKQRKPQSNEAQYSASGCCSWWETEPGICGVANGVPARVDRLKGLGNAIVPQVAFEIFKAINKLT